MTRHLGSSRQASLGLCILLGLAACGGPASYTPDGGLQDAGPGDAGPGDAGPGDAGPGDAGEELVPARCEPQSLPSGFQQGSWDPEVTIAGLSGADGISPMVNDFTIDTAGNVVATGYFAWAGDQRVPPLVVRNSEGKWEPARTEWELGPAAGGFSAVSMDQFAGQLALATHAMIPFALQGQVWADTGSGLKEAGSFTGLVRTMAWVKGKLWVAGHFEMLGTGVKELAVWDGTTWSPPPGGPADGAVYELLPINDGNEVMVGGAFANVGGIPAQRVAALDTTSGAWTAYDFPGGEGDSVFALAYDPMDDVLYAGGSFSSPTEANTGSVARWNGTGWDILGGGVSQRWFRGVVSDMLMKGGQLYITGCFDAVNGPSTNPAALAAHAVARWDGTAWQSLDDGTQGLRTAWYVQSACGDEGPYAIWDVPHRRLAADYEHVYVGGTFSGIGGVHSQSLIAHSNEEGWVAQGTPGKGLAGNILDFEVGGPDCALHAVGTVTHAGGEKMPAGVMRYQDGWTALGGPLPAGHSCASMAVSAEGTVYLGCDKKLPDLSRVGQVLRLEGDQWVALGEEFTQGNVADLALDPSGQLWVVGGNITGYVARWNGQAFEVLDDRFDKPVLRLAFRPQRVSGGPQQVVVGGSFKYLGTDSFPSVAHWDGSTWKPLGEGLSSSVVALEWGARHIYAATTLDSVPFNRKVLARWDGTRWEDIATPANGLPAPMGRSVHTFTSLQEVGGHLVAAGYVWPESGGRNAFVFDGDQFQSVGGGVGAIAVDALAVMPDGLWLGGTIATVDEGAAQLPSVGAAHFRWPTSP